MVAPKRKKTYIGVWGNTMINKHKDPKVEKIKPFNYFRRIKK